MKNSKKISALLFSLISVLSLSSCNFFGDFSAEEDVKESGQRIVKIMFHVDSRTAEGKAYKARIDAFNQAYEEEGIKASATFKARTTGGADYQQQLIALKTNGTLPDIITFDAPNCASYAEAGLLYNIDDQVSEKDRSDFLSLNTYKGEVYGLPIQESSAGFFYNKKMFIDAGIDASKWTVDNPWTFAEFKEVCQKLKNNGIATPVDMRFDATKDEMGTYLLYPFIYAAGGQFVSEDGLTAKGYFNSDKTKAGFQFLKDLVDSGYTSYAVGATDFYTQKTAMYLSSGWTIPEIDSKYKEFFPDRNSWGLLPYPQQEKKASATGSWSYGITINHVKDKEAALELLSWMTTAQSCNKVANSTGMVPVRRSCKPSYEEGSPEKVLFDQLDKTGIARPETICYPQFSSAFCNVIYKMRALDVSSAVESATTELQSELDKKVQGK